MPTIRVSEEVFEHLKRHAEPIVDSANDVLDRVLSVCPLCGAEHQEMLNEDPSDAADIEGSTRIRRRSSKGRRLPAGQLLVHSAYEVPILVALDERGGSAPVSEVIERVGQILSDKFGEADRSLNASGGVRWVNRTQWMRQRLVEAGHLAKDSPRGIWTITESGRKRLLELTKKAS